MASNPLSNQIGNRNFLSPVGFKFTLARYPKVSFFANSVRIPEISMSLAIQPNYLNDIPVPGTAMTFGDFNLRFLVDEDMENYMAVHNWLTGLGFPETTEQFTELTTTDSGIRDQKSAFSDGSLYILNSNFRNTAVVKFKDLFPVSLTSLEFDATPNDIQYFTAEASFKYTVYNILGNDNKPL